jgi:phosphoribosyl-ATP pyrophosphohydrolase
MSQIFKELEKIIAERRRQNCPSFYTCRLLSEGRLVERKLHEEAYELIEAAFNGEKKEIVYEAADLLFHFLVLLSKHDVAFQEVEAELIKRRRK